MSEQNLKSPDSRTCVNLLPSVAIGYDVAVFASVSSVSTTAPSNVAPNIKSYSPESIIAVIATLSASRSSESPSSTAIPNVSSEKVTIRSPDSARTGESPIA